MRKTGNKAGQAYFLPAVLILGAFFAQSCTYTVMPPQIPVYSLRPQAIEVIEKGLADEDPHIRTSAVEVIARTKQIRLMPKVQPLLRDEFVPVRFAAALAVGDLEYALAEKSIRQLLNSQDQNDRIAAAYALIKLGNANYFAVLRDAITSQDQLVRANTALALGRTGDKQALELLYWAINDDRSDDKTVLQAVESIAMLGDERIYPRLWAKLISIYNDDRLMGVRAMGALGSTEAKNALIRMLDDDVLQVRLAAAGQLGQLGETTGEPEVLDVFRTDITSELDESTLEQVRVLTALAVGGICTNNLVPFLPKLLQDKSKLVRIAAAEAVFHCTESN